MTETRGFAGASYVIVQKYLHDLATWNALPVEAQEEAIGRTKLSNVELAEDVKPTNSHVALNTIVGPDGVERQIVRANMPFGTVGGGEFGTYFIGYCHTPTVIEQMLENMFLGDPPGQLRPNFDFSTAVTGTLFFVPTADFLDDPPPLPSQGKSPAPPPPRRLPSRPTRALRRLRLIGPRVRKVRWASGTSGGSPADARRHGASSSEARSQRASSAAASYVDSRNESRSNSGCSAVRTVA